MRGELMIHRLTRPPRGRLGRIAIVVALVHLMVMFGIDRLSGLLSVTEPRREALPMSIRVAALPARPAPAKAKPRPVASDSDPAPALQTSSTSNATPATDNPPDASTVREADSSPGPPPEVLAQQPAATPDLASRTPSQDELPRSGSVAIDAYWGDHVSGSHIASGSIELSFPSEERYLIRIVTRAIGWASIFANSPLTAEAVGTLGPGGLRPERYSHRSMRGREELSTFDYERGEIRYSSLREPLPMPAGIQDRLSFMIQLAWMLRTDPQRFGLGESVRLPMAGRNRVEDVDFMVMSESDLVMPGGVLVPALHLSTMRQGERFRGQIDIWLDRADRLLPVRIRFEEARGQVLDLLTVRKP
jgi:hypothetical protein